VSCGSIQGWLAMLVSLAMFPFAAAADARLDIATRYGGFSPLFSRLVGEKQCARCYSVDCEVRISIQDSCVSNTRQGIVVEEMGRK
jgi:hypothetical protein